MPNPTRTNKRIENERENWVIFKDVHEPIIDRAVWEQVQQKRGKTRKRRTNEGERNMFSGLLVCADCGSKAISTSISIRETWKSSKWVQKLTIHYNCVGAIFIPDIFPCLSLMCP